MNTPPVGAEGRRSRVLVPVTAAFHGRLRVSRSTGRLDAEGLERVLSDASMRAIGLAQQLQAEGAELVAVHVNKGGGEEVLREALAYGLDQGILVEGAEREGSDASTRAATIADVYRQHGPFDAVVGPARSEFGGFSGALAAVAGHLEMPCFVGVNRITPQEGGFRIGYQSLFGEYDLAIPRPAVVLAGDLPPVYPTSQGIHDAYWERGLLRVQADQYTVQHARTRRLRIEAAREEAQSLEDVDAATLVRRLKSRALIPEDGP